MEPQTLPVLVIDSTNGTDVNLLLSAWGKVAQTTMEADPGPGGAPLPASKTAAFFRVNEEGALEYCNPNNEEGWVPV